MFALFHNLYISTRLMIIDGVFLVSWVQICRRIRRLYWNLVLLIYRIVSYSAVYCVMYLSDSSIQFLQMSKMHINGLKMDNHSERLYFNLDNVALSRFLPSPLTDTYYERVPVCAKCTFKCRTLPPTG